MSIGDRICPKCQEIFAGEILVCPHDGRKLLVVLKAHDDRVGELIDEKFTILGILGTGGMGTVYRALQHSMEREVAIKVLRKSLSEDITLVKRFLVEAKGVSRLNHPNIITLFDFGQSEEGELYLVMELLEGLPLGEMLERHGRMEPERAVAIIVQVLDALYAAHEHGVVHRDLKPDNIFIVQGAGSMGEFVKVLDFGIAKMKTLDADNSITRTGNVCGTPQYMSPEQAMGEEVDARSDIYAVAVVLYEMLTGMPPFSGDTPMKVMVQQVNDHPPPLSTALPAIEVTQQLEAVILKGLAKEAGERPSSGVAFKELLLGALSEGDTMPEGASAAAATARPSSSELVQALAPTLDVPMPVETGTRAAAPPPRKSSRMPWVIAAAAIVAAIGISAWAITRGPDGPASPDAVEKAQPAQPFEAAEKPAPKPPQDPKPSAAPPPRPAAPLENTANVVLLPRRHPEAAAAGPRVGLELDIAAVEPPPAPVVHTTRLRTKPRGAAVLVDGESLGKTPMTLTLPQQDETRALKLQLRGFRTHKMTLTHKTPSKLEIRLKRRTAKPPRAETHKPAKGPVLVE